MKYYLHSVDTMDDEKVAELFRKYGYEGTGLFHAILEKLAKQEKPVKTDILKFQLKVGKKLNKIWLFMEEIELICSTNGETFNNNLLNFSESYKIKKEKTRKKVSEWRENQLNVKSVTSYETVSNHSKVKESKVKEINNINKEQNFIKPTGLIKNPLEPKKPDSDSDSVNDKIRFIIPPSILQVERYCIERKNGVIPQKFMDYYDTVGWFVGKKKMKDWKAAVRTWENNDKKNSEPEKPQGVYR